MSLNIDLVVKSQDAEDNVNVYSVSGLTHNLGKMADRARIYKVIWRPEEVENFKNTSGDVYAHNLIIPLAMGLDMLKMYPSNFEKLNPINGWGSYTGFVEFVKEYLAACKANPMAIVEVHR